MAICLIALGAVWVVLNPAPVVQTKKEPVVKKTLAYQEAMAARDQENEKKEAERAEAPNDPIEGVLAGEQTGEPAEDLAALPGEAEPLPWANQQSANQQPGGTPAQPGSPPQAGYPPQDAYAPDAYAGDPYGQAPGAPRTDQAAPGAAPNPFDRNAPGQNPYAANAPGGQQAARQRPPADPYGQAAPPYGAPPPGQQAYPGQPAYPGQDAYGQDPYAQDPYAQDPYAQNPYGEGADPEAPYGRHPYSGEPLGPDGQVARAEQPNTFPGEPAYPAQDPYGAPPPGQGQPPYPGQGQPPYPGQGQPVYPSQGQAAYPGQAPYGAPGQPGGQNEEWVKVISSGTGMRNSASEDAPILFAFPYGRNLKVLSRNGEWVEVSDPNSATKGWMLAHTLEPTANPNAYAQRPFYGEEPKQRSGGLFRNFLNRAFGN